eukprot:TRINITY_DN1944_c0_g1_i3.p1 TRINITY_DN1944_c0_g1~~TRINITY_DN1944_c0_g1_i3.p1  ORF type:complete len:525 (-),score=148.96 TRINITY_DN1944_c0_g1_i3:65-1639(-)
MANTIYVCTLLSHSLFIHRTHSLTRKIPSLSLSLSLSLCVYVCTVFTNWLRVSWLEELAEADHHEVVRQVQEYYADYYAINPDFFSLNIPSCSNMMPPSWDQKLFDRVADGLIACLLSLKKRPHIRYESSSELTQRLAQEVAHRITQENALFDFRRTDTPPLLLILDRRNDPVTPLLNQWTYQAMIHELLTISNNRVDMSNVRGIRKDMQQIVVNGGQDDFYRENMYLNFGDLGMNIKTLVDDFQAKSHTTKDISSISDMQRFIEDYPEFRKMSGNVSKHVQLVSEMSRLVEQGSLMEVSELEQDLACNENHSAHHKALTEMLRRPSVTNKDKIRLVILYALRYEKRGSELTKLMDVMARNGISPAEFSIVTSVLKYAGRGVRGGDLFSNKNVFAVLKKSIPRGLKGVTNVLTQHQPLLYDTLVSLFKGKLKTNDFPFAAGQASKDRPQNVIVFIVGGATYEEARVIAELNALSAQGGDPKVIPPGTHIVLGGTTAHNSSSFLEDIRHLSPGDYRSGAGSSRLR